MGNSNSAPDSTDGNGDKKSIYRRYEDKKRGPGPSDEDILKYTGKTRDELNAWAENQPGVGKNQAAGKLTVGASSGFAGAAAAGGLGGWGTEGTRKMKFPVKQEPAKTVDDSDEE
ncbi:uncharacterized protein TRIVIDRAFT_215039 [Trichoderma virens Gv29-8]|uniref:Uncharacterized protein n=1 Tax=Hypocrea virens (strain Gv29-8 / FGSC 10586) TaxID=413071 RepID=G9MF47_HYPVG|nr:uncharacterized protein TRIVIDRAFT_215039 [Trichoderma virens Gv29-8]EHK27013.1 hypothetical protein TRIVIDRAFT_215039 [Trichoderma virens Gv29-8]UKZ57465.1 hypothetical protein TrVGV298_011322 [Trichoderma virens]UKZ83180.1 hypothetical protein TrVFT333_010985 [Trichoderma virens FT-333]